MESHHQNQNRVFWVITKVWRIWKLKSRVLIKHYSKVHKNQREKILTTINPHQAEFFLCLVLETMRYLNKTGSRWAQKVMRELNS